ncbi:peptidase inhibitor family I36 protein [Kribbella sp. CA-293567]|uniref:peptidase inhibitor family I36 protein n=1 Tax=Kribbella sp. CA-293567 TaxID=3002436 RepID=UPI0022DD4DAE|nr:peptidase inhibitor family I36 protein [Kribbella sp. CA-293567]WBQ02207.1 peptidase inhibitor family I36 protein [Kribbella sp. CA-293567]
MKLRLALGVTAAAAVVAVGITPASAAQDRSADAGACVPGIACFYETTAFGGRSVHYASPSTSCTRLPFVPGSLFNWSTKDIYLYRTADCTGVANLEPANNFHSYPSTKFLSFRAG